MSQKSVVSILGFFLGFLPVVCAQDVVDSIAELWADFDGDGIPDRVGTEVLVTGWFNVDSHHLDTNRMDVYFQDDSGGLLMVGEGDESRVGEGRRALVSGVLSNEAHQLVLHFPKIQPFTRQLRLLKPEDLTDGEDRRGQFLVGRLVAVSGIIQRIHQSAAGILVDVSVSENPEDWVTLHWPAHHKTPPDLQQYKEGHRINVAGILVGLGGHAEHAPFPEIWPRYTEDLDHLGFTPEFYRNLWFGLGAVILVILLYGFSLQARVKVKTADLREIQQRFQAVYESAADAIVIADNNGKVRSLNPATERMTGYSTDTLRSRSFTQLLAGDRQAQWDAITEAFRTRKGYADVHQLVRKNQEVLDVDLKVSTVELSGREYMLMLIRDITEMKAAQANLLKEKERLSVTLNSVVDGVVTTNTEGLIQSLNPAAEKLLGTTGKACAGTALSDVGTFLEDEDRPFFPVQKVLQKRRVVELPVRTTLIRLSDNRTVPVSGSSSPMTNEQGHVTGVVLVVRDISERMKIEGELQKASKLESIGLLAGGIAHDFNNIMTSVTGNLELATEALGDGGPDDIQACLREASTSSTRARALTTQLLTFARGGDPIKTRCEVKALLEELQSLALSGTDVEVKKVVAEDVWAIDVDKLQMLQALSNLVINAKEAIGSSGTIVLRAENMRVDTYAGNRRANLEPGEYIHITISDNGNGIAPEYRDQIFDPYFSTKKEGSGLGLSVAYSIIHHHQGFIEVDSEPDNGTSVSLYLPKSRNLDPAPFHSAADAKAASGRVLILDDEPAIRRVASQFLKKSDFTCETAETGEEAIEKYVRAMEKNEPFDVVLMDLTIPGGMGGEEAMKRLREIDPGVKGIVSSGYSNDPVMASHRDYGFQDVVPKPYSKAQLVEAVNRVLNGAALHV